MEKHMRVPFTRQEAATLKSGDYVYLTGTIYTARDAAHKRMYEALMKKEALPFDIRGNVIYYMGPSPAREGRPIGSAGPTTASRMDKYTPALLDLGMQGLLGKGKRTEEVREALSRNGAVYFAAVGGAGALLSKSILSSEVIAYDDLGNEWMIHSTRKAIVGEVIGLDFEPEDIHVMRLNETEEEFDARIEEYVEVEEQEAGLINAIEEERDEENNL